MRMKDLPYSTIDVTGPDALSFLQGQLTANLDRMAPGTTTLAAWCNPKGRVICIFRLTAGTDGYALTLPAELADDVVKRLTLYRFRAKVEFASRCATPGECGLDPDDIQAGLLGRLRDGIPEIGRAQSEKYTAHMLNLDLLGAVALDKGCYTGQEIIARTHYRGGTRRRCLRFESSGPVSVGDKVSDGDGNVGEVVNCIGGELLAVVAIDSDKSALSVNGEPLLHLPLPYLE